MTAVGPGRVLAAAYLLFVVAAGSRSIVQLATDPQHALLAYVLSALAALAYLVGLVLLVRADRDAGTASVARVWCVGELIAVVAVGTWTVMMPSRFPDATVWSRFGRGYGFVPLVLPILALWWLCRSTSRNGICRRSSVSSD